jgi:predicted RNase H-like nuclease
MTDAPQFVGAVPTDGDVWLAVAFASAPGDPPSFDGASVLDGAGGVWPRYGERAVRVLLAVPIGLFEGEAGAAERDCDRLARSVLGPRATAVDDPPVRAATRKRRYPAAKRLTERTTGRTLSRRAFALSESIADVDELLREVPEAREVVAESHPELCFRAFAGTPLEHEPATAGGYAERMRSLAEFDPDAPRVVQSAAEAVAGEPVRVRDVLDAVALAYAARPGPGSLRSLPPDPPADGAGLPMRIVYRASTPLVTEA